MPRLPCQLVRGASGFWWPSWSPFGVGLETWWWCHSTLPWGVTLLLCFLLAVAAPPRSRVGSSRVIDAEPQIRCLIFQLQLEGCTARCCALWQQGTVMGFLLIRQGGHAVRMGLRASLRKEIMARLPSPEEDTQKQAPAGSFGLTSAPLNSPRRHRLPLSPPGAFWRGWC